MKTTPAGAQTERWDLLILDADPPATDLGSLGVGDIDGDGRIEVVIGGAGALLWYRPETREKGVIAQNVHAHVGLALEDIDGDGQLEVFIGETVTYGAKPETWRIAWYDPQPDLRLPWTKHIVDPLTNGGAHDLLFADVDGDGANELVANAVYCATPGTFFYRRGRDLTAPWQKYTIQEGLSAEGTCAVDLDGDGRVEVISGPYLFVAPTAGPLAGLWQQNQLAPGFREMCRVAVLDMAGNGKPDVVLVESEYPDGRLAWFENQMREQPDQPWREHLLEGALSYAHSLAVWREPGQGGANIFVGEMSQGGWSAAPNYGARLLTFSTADSGRTWERSLIFQGEGTHEATVCDVDRDGNLEIIGKDWKYPKAQLWKRRQSPLIFDQFQHVLIDRQKPMTGTDILAVDVDADGLADIVCGYWWYQNPTWKRYEIPGIYQVINAYDLDRDGRPELIATLQAPSEKDNWYFGLSSELVWLRPIDPCQGKWEIHPIGKGSGDWPHGSLVAPVLPDQRLAFIVAYHSEPDSPYQFIEVFEVPPDPTLNPWPKRTLAEVVYSEEMVAGDVRLNGSRDILAGQFWLENQGDGLFLAHPIAPEGFYAARMAVTDINGDGRLDVVLGQEVLDYPHKIVPFSILAWFENTSAPDQSPWPMHAIDKVRCAHSLLAADLDGDGETEIICGEHDPFSPYRNQCHLYVYKKGDAHGATWWRYTLDRHSEHHDGVKLLELSPGRMGIISHGWQDTRYVHLWAPDGN